jgi:hypothetical protein
LHAKDLQGHATTPTLQVDSAVRQQMRELGYLVHSLPVRSTGTIPMNDVFSLWHLWRLLRRIRPCNVCLRIVHLVLSFGYQRTLGLYLDTEQI